MKNPTRGVQSIRPEIDSLASEYSRQPAAVLEVFQALQKRNGGLRTEDIQEVAAALRIPEERAFGVASFYSMLALQPEPKEVLRICDGPPCWLRGSQAIHTAAEENLAEAFRIERTSCLGLCDRAPAGLVGLDPCGPLTQGKLDEIREGWRGKTMDYSVPRAGEVRVLLANIDSLDPRSLESAREQGAY